MSKYLNIILYSFIIISSIPQVYGEENQEQPIEYDEPKSLAIESNKVDVDAKNILAVVNNLVILRSFANDSFFSVNSDTSYLEAYDIEKGNRVWSHKDSGMIVSFVVVNNERIIFRNYGKITCLDVRTGKVAWSKQTLAAYSTVISE